MAKITYINKDGTANKVYVKKMWNHVMNTAIDSFNGEVDKHKFRRRTKEFDEMVNKLIAT